VSDRERERVTHSHTRTTHTRTHTRRHTYKSTHTYAHTHTHTHARTHTQIIIYIETDLHRAYFMRTWYDSQHWMERPRRDWPRNPDCTKADIAYM